MAILFIYSLFFTLSVFVLGSYSLGRDAHAAGQGCQQPARKLGTVPSYRLRRDAQPTGRVCQWDRQQEGTVPDC